MMSRISMRPARAWRVAALVLLGLSVVESAPPAGSTSASPDTLRASQANSVERSTGQAAVAAAYADLPLRFEPNQGQAAGEIDFLARGGAYTVLLGANRAVLALRPPTSAELHHGSEFGSTATATANDITPVLPIGLWLVDANPQTTASGEDPLAGTVNYFVGSNPTQWHAAIPTYGAVRYRGVYPEVDLVYRGRQGQLEYDFDLGPGADPSTIRLAVEGTEQVELTADGELVLHTTAGDLRQPKPVLYQGSDSQRAAVDGGYVLSDRHEVGFWVGAYDPARPLTIDPMLVYATYLGGSVNDAAFGIAVDTAGNAYITGETQSTDFPTTSGAFQQKSGGGFADAFVAKLNASGTGLVYSTYLGGSSIDEASAIAVDGDGNAYVAGNTRSTDFPTTAGAFQRTFRASAGEFNGFVAKLNANGAELLYSTYLGGSGSDFPGGIAVDHVGNAYVAGSTRSPDFPTVAGAFEPSRPGSTSGFVTKLNASGTQLVYSTYLGGSGFDSASAIAIDRTGAAYVTGSALSTDFPTTPGAFQRTLPSASLGHAFVTKLNRRGTALVYSTYLGGGSSDGGTRIALDRARNAYVTGRTQSRDFPTTPGAFQTAFHGGIEDAFVSKLNASGTRLIYSTYLGGNGNDAAFGIAVNRAGNAYVAGFTSSTNFPTTSDAFQRTLPSGTSAFVTKLNANGTQLVYSTYLGGSGFDDAFAIALDRAGNAYVAGGSGSADFPTTPGAVQSTRRGVEDGFVAKFGFERRDLD